MRIFLIECSAPHWLDVAERLKERSVEIALWTGWSRIEADVRKKFVRTTFHETFNAKIGMLQEAQAVPLSGFDAACQEVWKQEAQVIYDMMNRFDYSQDQTFVERSTLFLEHLVYWRWVLLREAPDLVVFSSPPHVVYDYILLALCRATGIRTLMFEEATIYPPYCLEMTDYRVGSTKLAAQAKRRHVPSPQTMAIVTKLRGGYDLAKPPREVEAQAEMTRQINAGLDGLRESAATIKAIDREHGGGYAANEKIVNVGSAYKEKGVTLRNSFAGNFANTRFVDQRLEQFERTLNLRTFYHANATPLAEIEEPFIYVALAGQPERTSNPQADILANQLLMVNMLAYGSNAAIAVKEHPNQFHPGFTGPTCRDVEYYKSLLRTRAVRLVSTAEDPFAIIDRAVAVATTGGTSALEAVARGKPALLFGDAWYRDCPGVHRIRSLADVQRIVSQPLSQLAATAEEFESYVEAITKGCFRGLGDYPAEGYEFDREENISELTRAVCDHLPRRSS